MPRRSVPRRSARSSRGPRRRGPAGQCRGLPGPQAPAGHRPERAARATAQQRTTRYPVEPCHERSGVMVVGSETRRFQRWSSRRSESWPTWASAGRTASMASAMQHRMEVAVAVAIRSSAIETSGLSSMAVELDRRRHRPRSARTLTQRPDAPGVPPGTRAGPGPTAHRRLHSARCPSRSDVDAIARRPPGHATGLARRDDRLATIERIAPAPPRATSRTTRSAASASARGTVEHRAPPWPIETRRSPRSAPDRPSAPRRSGSMPAAAKRLAAGDDHAVELGIALRPWRRARSPPCASGPTRPPSRSRGTIGWTPPLSIAT